MVEPGEVRNTELPQGGLNVEVRFAHELVRVLDPTKRIYTGFFKDLVRPLTMDLSTDEPNLPEAYQTREHLERISQTLAMILCRGNPEKAKILIGPQFDQFTNQSLNDPNYVERVTQMIKKISPDFPDFDVTDLTPQPGEKE